MVRAAIDGLTQLITVDQAARERGIEPSAIGYKSRAKSRSAESALPGGVAVLATEGA